MYRWVVADLGTPSRFPSACWSKSTKCSGDQKIPSCDNIAGGLRFGFDCGNQTSAADGIVHSRPAGQRPLTTRSHRFDVVSGPHRPRRFSVVNFMRSVPVLPIAQFLEETILAK